MKLNYLSPFTYNPGFITEKRLGIPTLILHLQCTSLDLKIIYIGDASH